jgi:hypothetical protein
MRDTGVNAVFETAGQLGGLTVVISPVALYTTYNEFRAIIFLTTAGILVASPHTIVSPGPKELCRPWPKRLSVVPRSYPSWRKTVNRLDQFLVLRRLKSALRRADASGEYVLC